MGVAFDDLESIDFDAFNNVLIVDSLNLCFRYLHSNTSEFAATLFSTIDSFAKSYKADKVFVLGDWGSNYRYNLFPEYKGDRKEKRKDQTEEEKQTFSDFLDEYNKGLELISTKHTVIKYKGVEADDIAAYLVKYIPEDKYDHIWLLSTDHDWSLLIGDKVSRFAYTTRKEFTKDTFEGLVGYPLADHLSIKVLQGDKSDSIPGIEQVGIKRATTLVRQYGSAFDIYDALPLDGTQKFIQNTNAFGDKILLNYELMDLVSYCDEALGLNVDELDKIIKEI
jgi:5'-3' exonuclease